MLRAAFTSALHDPALQATHWKTAWLLRFSGATCPQREHRCDVYAAGTNSSRPAALCLSRATSIPHPWRLISRLSPRFCATLVPGRSRVPRADRVIARTFKSSTLMVSKPRATSVVAFSTQSRRRSVSRVRRRAMASLVRAPSGSALRSGQMPLQSTQSFGFAGTKARSMSQLPAGQGDRDRYATVYAYRAAVTGSWDGVGDESKCDVPAPRAIQGDSVGLDGVGEGAGPAEAHPPGLGDPYLSVAAVEPFDVARLDPNLPESLMRAGLAPRRATVGAAKEVAHRLGEVPQRLLLYRLRSGRQPAVFGPGRSQLATLLVVARRVAAGLPVLLLFDGQVPHKPGMATVFDHHCRLLRAGKQPKSAHLDNLGSTTDNMLKMRRAFFPG
jgi:hypothetical protein